MKKIMICMIGLIVAGVSVLAQCPEGQCPKTHCDSAKVRCEKPKQQLCPQQKAQLITDRMVKAYDLNEEQKAKLLELNLKALKREGRGCYFAGLKEILTPEQFKSYTTDKRIERQMLPNPKAQQRPSMRRQGMGRQRMQGRGPQMRDCGQMMPRHGEQMCFGAGPMQRGCQQAGPQCQAKGNPQDCKMSCNKQGCNKGACKKHDCKKGCKKDCKKACKKACKKQKESKKEKK